MNYLTRDTWTSRLPWSSTRGDTFEGMPFFEGLPVGVEFVALGRETLYVKQDPTEVLNMLLKETNQTGLSDIPYNYAIAQNRTGVFVVRGGITKCPSTKKLRVLMLIGKHEEPTDCLKDNQLLVLGSSNPPPLNPMFPGDSSIHVFNLIEFLASRGLYKARNDGVYGAFCTQAVHQLQIILDNPQIDGNYDTSLIDRLCQTELTSQSH